MSATSALEVAGVTKRYGTVVAVDHASFALGAHEIVALVGPSGCGKSTLLRVIAGLVPAEAGRVCLRGRAVDDGRTHVPPEDRRIGLVFQDHSLFPHLPVRDNVAFGVRGLSRAARARRVGEILDLVHLAGFGDRYPHELSGGQRQRVAVARALAPGPELVLLDEPFANLDHNLRVQVRAEVTAALRATGTPAVLVTHDQREALAVGDRIGVMRAGRIVHLDRPDVVFHEPASRFVGAFMGEASFLDITLGDGGPRTAMGALGVDAVPDRALAMVRPDDVQFCPDPAGDAEVVATCYQGASWLYTLRLAAGGTVMAEGSHLAPVPVGTRGRATMTAGHRQVVVVDDRPDGDAG